MGDNKLTSFTKLDAWKKSHELVLEVMKVCETMPRYDALRSQLERAALCITRNIAEGFGRQTINDKKYFYVIARGSAYEVQNQLLIGVDSHKITREVFQELAYKSVSSIKLIHGLIRSLEKARNATS